MIMILPLLLLSSLSHFIKKNLDNMLVATSFSYYLILVFLIITKGGSCATFTFVNKCDYTVWPGILASAGSPNLESTGFELVKGTSRSFNAPAGWSGRFWARTRCSFDASGLGSCVTADCESGQLECNGAGAAPPATLAEFTLGSGAGGTQDFYDVSLVDGYNLPMIVEGSGGSGTCGTTGCASDLNRSCPNELKTEDGDACKSACGAFGTEEYCCNGAYGSPDTCKPSLYSQVFKAACPKSYSYAYDDASSTFTCTGADYTITFCASLLPSVTKSAKNAAPQVPNASGSTGGGSESEGGAAFLAGLAIGDSTKARPSIGFHIMLILVVSFAPLYSKL